MLAQTSILTLAILSGSAWDRIGPWNIYNDRDVKGEAGTIACAASPAAQPNLIYAGGQNNGVSSGMLRTINGGVTWERKSKGLWDTRILGVWVPPDDASGQYVFAGTHSGIYESHDGAESWTLCDETRLWGPVISFRGGALIDGVEYILANTQGYGTPQGGGLLTRRRSGGSWQFLVMPGAPNWLPMSQHLTLVVTNGSTEVFSCVEHGGGLYRGRLTSPTNATWVGPLATAEGPINCYEVAVDPNDRDHLLYSGPLGLHESMDGGASTRALGQHTHAFHVGIDAHGWLYTASQAGAYVSNNSGVSWSALHVLMHMRQPDGRTLDRVAHDYQRIVPDFRGDGIAFPSDQGLHILNRSSVVAGECRLISAVGDLHNAMSLSAIISPNAEGSRNIVVNMWDWDVLASWDDGRTWADWTKDEYARSPHLCGEGGGGKSLGASGYAIMLHGKHWWHSADGGHNWTYNTLPGSISGVLEYERRPGSRTEPSGRCYSLMSAPPGSLMSAPPGGHDSDSMNGVAEREDREGMGEGAEGEGGEETGTKGYRVERYGVEGHVVRGHGWEGLVHASQEVVQPSQEVYLLTSNDYGRNWTWAPLPAGMPHHTIGLAADPTDSKRLYAFNASCLASSDGHGVAGSWSRCSQAPGLVGTFAQLLVKDGSTLFMMRGPSRRTAVSPLRSLDGGNTWAELPSMALLLERVPGVGLSGSLSWSGRTLVLHGNDRSAIGRKEYGTIVWKSHDDGETWADETGDLVTISPGPGVWFERDFYLVTRGEGITVKRDLEPAPALVEE